MPATATAGRHTRAATIAEALVGMFVFSVFALAILGTLATAGSLSQRDAEITQINALAQSYLEEQIGQARSRPGFDALAEISLRPSEQAECLYQLNVSEPLRGLKKLTVTLYYADPETPGQVDLRRPNGGRALTLGTAVERP